MDTQSSILSTASSRGSGNVGSDDMRGSVDTDSSPSHSSGQDKAAAERERQRQKEQERRRREAVSFIYKLFLNIKFQQCVSSPIV